MTAKVLVLGCGEHALIDEEFYALVSSHSWRLDQDGIIVASVGGAKVRLHCLVYGTIPRGKTIDHIDRDRLNNQRGNLRAVHYSMQNFNQGKKTNRSGERCVSVTGSGTFRVCVWVNRKRIRGTFKTMEEAVAWRDARYMDNWGELAK